MIASTIHCARCGKDFSYCESDIQTRDLGIYPGTAPMVGKDRVVKCPHCTSETTLPTSKNYIGRRHDNEAEMDYPTLG